MPKLKTLHVYLYKIFEKPYAEETIIPFFDKELGSHKESNYNIGDANFRSRGRFEEKRMKWQI